MHRKDPAVDLLGPRALKGAPTGCTLPVREVPASVGAGIVYPICGHIRTMPGLGSSPAVFSIDLDARGEVVGCPDRMRP